MLTKVTVHNPLSNVDPLILNITERPETDLFEVRNIDGLGEVTANINTTALASVDKEAFTGSNAGKRNIVLTLGLTPDWVDWTVFKLRRFLTQYFTRKMQTRLVFESTEFSPVEIFGHIESNEPNIFSKDPEHQISIICPDPDFISVDPFQLFGETSDPAMSIDYAGNLPTGIGVIVNNFDADPDPAIITISVNNFEAELFTVNNGAALLLDSTHSFFMYSVPGEKQVKQIVTGPPPDVSLLSKITDGSIWPTIKQGVNLVDISTDTGVQTFSLAYYEHFGSL